MMMMTMMRMCNWSFVVSHKTLVFILVLAVSTLHYLSRNSIFFCICDHVPLLVSLETVVMPVESCAVFQFAAMNMTGQCVAVAGKCGLAHCMLYARKWKLFGNETQA